MGARSRPLRYGAVSGGTLERPALKLSSTLLAPEIIETAIEETAVGGAVKSDKLMLPFPIDGGDRLYSANNAGRPLSLASRGAPRGDVRV